MNAENNIPAGMRLRRRGDQVLLDSLNGQEPVPVKLLWARPISGRGTHLSILDDKRTELALLDGLATLDPESRRIAEEDLARRYLVPQITRVIRTRVCFGIRYLRVDTDLGRRDFAFKDASRNVVWISDDHVMLRDTMGCRYEIKPFSGLDPASQREVRRVL